MKDGIEKNPDVWQTLFPNGDRRALAQNFTEEISKVPGVEVILSVSRRTETGFNSQTLYILVSKDTTQENADLIQAKYCEICPNRETRNLLGHIWLGAENDFIEKRKEELDLRYQTAATLWQKPSELARDITLRRDFNGVLN